MVSIASALHATYTDGLKRARQIADLGGSRTANDKIQKKVAEITDLEGVPYRSYVFKVDNPPARAKRMEERNELVLMLERHVTDWLEACIAAKKLGQAPPHPEPMMRPYA